MKNFDRIPRDIVPVKGILPNPGDELGYESPEITKRKKEFSKLLLEGSFDSVKPEIRPTVLDFHGLSPDSTEKDFFAWVEREIGIKQEVLEGKSQESKDAYRILDFAYQKGKDFLKNVLKYSDAEVAIGPQSLSSKEDIFSLLNKTVLIGGVSGLSKALLYCRLVKATIIAYEPLKHDAQLSKTNTEKFEKAISASPLERQTNDAPLIPLKENKFYLATHGGVKGTISYRGKDFDKVMLRFLTRPESSAKSALKDGIASRITIDKEQAKELIPVLCNWLAKNMKVSFINIENQEQFSLEEVEEIKKRLLENVSGNSFSISEHKPEPTSMGDFNALKMTGIIQLPGESSPHSRQFEIQIVSPFNKNESGRMHHSIYDIGKFIVARTRLDGGCPENIFNEFVKDASRESGISEKKIIYYLTEMKDSPVVRVKKKNNKNGESVYMASSVYSRWKEFGWVDGALLSDVERAKK